MKKLSRFEKIGLIAAVVVAGSFFYMKKVYEPQEKVLKATIVRLNKVVAERNALNEPRPANLIRKEIEGIREDLAEVEAQLSQVKAPTGADGEVTELLAEIATLTEQHALQVGGVEPLGKVTDQFFDRHAFQLELKGEFFDFLAFLEALRRLPDSVRADQVSLEALERGLRIQLKLMI